MKNKNLYEYTETVLFENNKEEDYWLNVLSGDIGSSSFFPGNINESVDTYNINSLEFNLSKKTTSILLQLSNNFDPGIHIILLTIIILLLYKYSGNTDIIVGVPIYKQKVEADFINTILAIRNQISDNMTFKELLIQVRKSIIEADENQNYPMEMIIQKLKIVSLKSNFFPLFDTIILMENIHDRKYIKNIDVNVIFSFLRVGECIKGRVDYNSSLFKKDYINRIITHLMKVLNEVLHKVDIPLIDLEMISEEEKIKLLCTFNNTKSEYLENKTIDELFQNQVEKTPNNVAVFYENLHLTYGALDERSNCIARLLGARGTKPNQIVGVMMERSLEMVIGIMGILKAGGAFLSINPDYPEDRIIYMLNDCSVEILLTKSSSIKKKSLIHLISNLKINKKGIYKTKPRPQIVNLNNLPYPNRALVNYETYNRYIGQTMVKNCISLQASRGCPYQCAYCHKIWPKHHVSRSADNIFEEVKFFYHLGIRRFSFIDDIFNLNFKNSSKFFKLIIKNKMKIQIFFPNGLRGDILTKEYIDLMIQAGVVNVALALETASPRLQQLIRKNLNIENLRENLEYFCKKYPHVILELFTIHGIPSETKEEALETLDFIKSLEWLHFPYIFILKIYQNTEMEEIAIENGITRESILHSDNFAYNELPKTLPFKKDFTLKYQADFLDSYFLLKERLIHVLKYQMKVLTEDEIVQKYNSYLPIEIKSFDDLLNFIGIGMDEFGVEKPLTEESMGVSDLNKKLRDYFPSQQKDKDALKILLLDLSQYFSTEKNAIYDVCEPPLGLMYILTYLNKKFGNRIEGRIVKSGVDFNNYEELKALIIKFKPDIIGVRSLTFYKDFFHFTVALIRQWGINVPIIAGGPYATCNYKEILQDHNIEMVILGEGEITFGELIKEFIDNNYKLPGKKVLKNIPGIAFVPKDKSQEISHDLSIIMLDENIEVMTKGAQKKIEFNNRPDHLAYIIYTSGSAGKPKAVTIEHKNVNNLIFGLDVAIYKNYEENLKIALVAPLVFDASVQQVFGALLLGHSLFIVPEDTRISGRSLIKYYNKNKIDISDGTPTHIRLILDGIEDDGIKIDVKHLIIGGAALQKNLVDKFFNELKRKALKITNIYGPAECCVDSSFYHIAEVRKRLLDTIPIGIPLSNVQIYILGVNKLQPIGIPGQLSISGSGLGRGYLNNVELTSKKFVKNPFQLGERLYLTGDLARWMPDGNIEFLGRIDRQVKIRGYRIEPEEIELLLMKHKKVKKAVVKAITEDKAYESLSAYIVSKEDYEILELREYLSKFLPEFMIPSYFIRINEIPLTTSGKVDLNNLPHPKINEKDIEIQPPTNHIEKNLIEIWADILGLDERLIGINSNYFELGGDSIKAIQISSRMHDRKFKIEIRDIFQKATIKEIAKNVKEAEYLDQGLVTGRVCLTPIQKYFFQNVKTDPHHFNQSVMLYKKDGFDEDILKCVFAKIIEHHDALRMVFEINKNEVIQKNRDLDGKLFDLEVFNFPGTKDVLMAIESESDKLQCGINLRKGPLVRLGLFKTKEGDHLLIIIHHLVVDSISSKILLEDFSYGYYQAEKEEEIKFQEKTHSFKDWAQQLSDYSEDHKLLNELTFWETIKKSEIKTLPKDFNITKEMRKNKNIDIVSMDLDKEETDILVKKVHKAFNTEINDILLTALTLSIKEWSGIEKILIDIEGHGREEIFEGVNVGRTVGWFASVFPIVFDMKYDEDISFYLKNVKETLRNIPNKGIGYSILKYLTAAKKINEIKFNINPEIIFNFLGEIGKDNVNKFESIQFSNINPGQNIGSESEQMYTISINAIIFDGNFSISLYYNRYEYKKSTIEKLGFSYISKLKNIINFCKDREETEITPSDLDYSEMDIDELDDIKNFVNQID